MPWPEVENVSKENRHELVLAGAAVSKRIEEEGLDDGLFNLSGLNYLDLHETCLTELPPQIARLSNLQTLVLHGNRLEKLAPELGQLSKLKLLDLSRNRLKVLPESVAVLPNLYSLNVSGNLLENFPSFASASKLTVLDLSRNKLESFPDVCRSALSSLSEVKLNGNAIVEIPPEIGALSSLKVLAIAENKVKTLPGELCDCSKLKEVDLAGNPIADRRLLKLIEQRRSSKQVLDYVKQHSSKSKTSGKPEPKANGEAEEQKKYKYTVRIRHWKQGTPKIVCVGEIKVVRPHIAACVVEPLDFTPETLKKFIKLQTKLHDTICDKRNSATIATHDFGKVSSGDLTYTALPPSELLIKPLNRTEAVTGAELYAKLKTEADDFRKEKKRNVYSGIHKYLYMLEGREKYPCLVNSGGEVISFPPITNSEISKISPETKAMLMEVTSGISQNVCKTVLDSLIRETLELFQSDLIVGQIKITDTEGNLRSVYPDRTDLAFENAMADVNVVRE